MSQSILLVTIGDLGIRNVLIRSIARDPSRTNDLMVNGAILRVVGVSMVMLFYIAYNYYLGSFGNTQLLLVFGFALTSCFANLFETVFLGNQKMLSPTLVNIMTSSLWFLIVLLLPSSIMTPVLLFEVYLFIHLIKVMVLWGALKFFKLFLGEVKNFWLSTRQMLSESWPFFLQVLLLIPITTLSNNFLDINSTQEEIGYFNLSDKLMGPVTLVIGFALSALFPDLSHLWASNEQKFYTYISLGFKFFLLSALLMCFLFSLFSQEIVVLLFTEAYLPAVKVCQLQVWYIFLMSVNSLIGIILVSANKEKLFLYVGIINTLIAVPFLYYGSKFGAVGLSYGYLLSFTIFEVYLWWRFKRAFKSLNLKNDTYVWMFAAFLFLASYLFPPDISVFYRIVFAFFITAGTSYYIFKNLKVIALK